MPGDVGLSLFRNFVTGADGRSNVNAENENEQARFSSRADGLELTSHDVSGTGNAFGRGLERVTRFFGRVFSIGRSNPPHKNFEVREAFRNAILAHLQREAGLLLSDDLPIEILKAFKGELWTNKPLTKRRIQAVLNTVDEYVSRAKENLTKNNQPDDKMITRPSDGGMIEMTDMSGVKEEEVKNEVKEEEKKEEVKNEVNKEEVKGNDGAKKELEGHINWLKNKIELEKELSSDDGVRLRKYEKILAEDIRQLEELNKMPQEEQKVEEEAKNEKPEVKKEEEKREEVKEEVKNEVKEEIKQQEQPKIEEPVKAEVEKKIEQKEEKVEQKEEKPQEVKPQKSKVDYKKIKDPLSMFKRQQEEASAKKEEVKNEVKVEVKEEKKEEKGEEVEVKNEVKVEDEKKIEQKEEQKEVKVEQKEVQIEVPVKEEKIEEPVKEEIKQQEPPKIDEQLKKPEVKVENVKPEPKVDKNVADKYLIGGRFKEEVFRAMGPRETLDEYNKKVHRLLREEIIPNCLPGLKKKIETLRQQTFEMLGVPEKYRDWFNKECYLLDTDSDEFLAEVRGSLSNNSVEAAEEKIIKRCRVKAECKFVDANGSSVVKNVLPVSDGSNAIVPKGKPLTLKAYDDAIKQFASKNNCRYDSKYRMDTKLQDLLEKAAKIEEIDNTFKKLKLDNAKRYAEDLIGVFVSDAYLQNEKQSIKDQILELVFGPLDDKKPFWLIEPRDYMRKLVEVCARSTGSMESEIINFINDLVGKIASEHFAEIGDVRPSLISSSKGNLISSERQNKMSPGQIIETAIKEQRGIQQYGAQNCFMVSIVNALLGNERGQTRLKECFCGGKGIYRFKRKFGDQVTVSDTEIREWSRMIPNLKDNTSSLECAIWIAWLKEEHGTLENFLKAYPGGEMKSPTDNVPGNACRMIDFAYLFGLEDISGGQDSAAKGGVKFPENGLAKWMEVRNQLASNQFAIVHKKTNRFEHYEAVMGVDSKDGKSFKVCDSMGRDEGFGINGLKSPETLRQIIQLRLP